MPSLGHQGGGHALDPQVDRSHRETPFPMGGNDIRPLGRHLREANSAPAIPGAAKHLGQQVGLDRRRRRAAEDAGPHRPAFAQVTREGAGVDASQIPTTPWLRRARPRGTAAERQLDGRSAGSRTAYPATQMREDSSSSSFQPVLPTCGAVMTTTCRW
jgi:hypothetical protein